MGREGLSRDMIDAGQGPDMDKLSPLPLPRFHAQEARNDQPAWIKKDEGAELLFHTVDQGKNFTMKPLYRVMDERFSTYWQKE
jgi:hypothetical protein